MRLRAQGIRSRSITLLIAVFLAVSAHALFANAVAPVERAVLYYWSGAQLRQYLISTGATSLVKTFPASLESLGGSADWIDRTGRYFLVSYSGSLHIWDKQTDTIFAGSVPNPGGAGWSAISPDGKYLIVTGNPSHWSYVINQASQTLSTSSTMFWSLCGDHSDVISPSDGKTYIIVFNCFDTPAVYRVDVSLPQTSGNTAQQKSQNVLLFLTDWNDDGHSSCASRGANGDWCFAAVESGDDAFGSQGAWRPFKQEIVMAQMVPPYTVRRLAHHRSRSLFTNYYYQPRVSASWDGTKAAWASNYGYSGVAGYADIFIVEVGGGGGDTTAPTVSLTAPAAGATVSGSTTVSATATDNVGVVGVQFKLDGANLGGEDTTAPYSVSWNTATASAGTHTLTAVARDAAGNTRTSAAVSVTVANLDTTLPTVSITAPTAGATVSGTVTITASASDNVGVTRLDYLLDGSPVVISSPPSLTFAWNSNTASPGTHTLTVKAYDAAGNTATSAAVTVTVSNDTTPPAVSLTAPTAG